MLHSPAKSGGLPGQAHPAKSPRRYCTDPRRSRKTFRLLHPDEVLRVTCKKSGKFQKSFSEDAHLAGHGFGNNLVQVQKRVRFPEPVLDALGGKGLEMERLWAPNRAARPPGLALPPGSPVTCASTWLYLAAPEPRHLCSITLILVLLSTVSPPPPHNVPWPLRVNSEIKSKFQFSDVNRPCDLSEWDEAPGWRCFLDSKAAYFRAAKPWPHGRVVTLGRASTLLLC